MKRYANLPMPTYLQVSGHGETSPGGVPVCVLLRLGGMSNLLRTADEVAARLQVPKSWVYRAARQGELPSVRCGRYRRFDDRDVDRWIDRCRQLAGAADAAVPPGGRS